VASCQATSKSYTNFRRAHPVTNRVRKRSYRSAPFSVAFIDFVLTGNVQCSTGRPVGILSDPGTGRARHACLPTWQAMLHLIALRPRIARAQSAIYSPNAARPCNPEFCILLIQARKRRAHLRDPPDTQTESVSAGPRQDTPILPRKWRLIRLEIPSAKSIPVPRLGYARSA